MNSRNAFLHFVFVVMKQGSVTLFLINVDVSLFSVISNFENTQTIRHKTHRTTLLQHTMLHSAAVIQLQGCLTLCLVSLYK